MSNSNINEVDKDTKSNESEYEINTTERVHNIIQKFEAFEEKLQNEVIITELKDKNNWGDTVNTSVLKKDTVINIGISETGALAYHVHPKKFKLWPLKFWPFRKHLVKKGDQEQCEHLKQKSQAFSKQRFTVLMQSYAPSDGAPLSYDPESRNSFILLVMIIVFVMLLFTTAFLAVVLATESLKEFFLEQSTIILILAIVVHMICLYSMMCSPCARIPPCNFVVLIFTTIAMSFLAAVISVHYRTEIILYAAICTAAIVLTCAGLACTSFDFTSWLLYVVVIGVAFSVVAMVALIGMTVSGHYMKPVHLGILIISVLIQSVALVIQLQMILGGKTVELSEDDYALGAFMLYTSIVDIFIKMVQILGLLDDS